MADGIDGDEERRAKQRKPTRIRAWADPGGVAAPADCVIVDLSEGGARITAVGDRPLPETFTLVNEANGTLGAASVMWRTDNMVGVRFEKSGANPEEAIRLKAQVDVLPAAPALRRGGKA